MTLTDTLAQAGYKLTTPRRRILDALRESETPLTALEVAARSGVSVASTYRALALLTTLGAISETLDPCAERSAGQPGALGGTGDGVAAADAEARSRRYAICTATGHHHHFTCRACHATLDVACATLETALAEIEQATGVRIERHDVTLGGLCPACQRAADSAAEE
ncbi:MAG: Fur family transcriptional regulator [Ktedonobacterales bacterium]